MACVELVINEYAKRARRLKKNLAYFSEFKHFNDDNCEDYLKLSREYRFITKMFDDMNLFDWSEDDFEYHEEKDNAI
jgi:hypothetical protein